MVKEQDRTRSFASIFVSVADESTLDRDKVTVIASILAILRQTSSAHRDALGSARVLADATCFVVIIFRSFLVASGCQANHGGADILALRWKVVGIDVSRHDV